MGAIIDLEFRGVGGACGMGVGGGGLGVAEAEGFRRVREEELLD